MRSLQQSCFLLFLVIITSSKGQQLCNEQPTPDCQCQIENSEKVINCRYKTLTGIPTFSPTTGIFDRIIFTSAEETGTCTNPLCNNITNVLANAFANLKVKAIDLRKNAIINFDQEAFEGLQEVLEQLLVEGDGQHPPPYGPMARLVKLKLLHMENFQQDEISLQNSLLDFSALQDLTIQKFSTLTRMESFPGLVNVNKFTLKFLPKMTSIPVQAIQAMTKLQILTVADAAISAVLGESFSNLDNITEINLERNKITTIYPTAFKNANDTLDYLTLSFNQLHSDSLSVFNSTQWQRLTHLDLSYNNIAPIPAMTFSTMQNLLYLNLQEVGLTRVQSSMLQGLNNLHTLELSYNLIATVEAAAFQSSPILEEIRLDNQQIVTTTLFFYQNSFEGIETSLQTLRLENNAIDMTIFWNNVKKFTNLLMLNIPKMNILEIPDYAFAQNTKLESIDLAFNNLTSLKQETFFGPKQALHRINLEGNKLQVFGDCLLADFPNKPTLVIANNLLTCDCRLRWLYDWLQNQADKITTSYSFIGECEAPANLNGKYLHEITRTQLCPTSYTPPTCPDLYLTTTTTKPTTTTTTTTARPMPTLYIFVGGTSDTTITITWDASDKTDITAYKLEMYSDNKPKEIKNIHRDEVSFTFSGLQPGAFYTFCLIPEINNIFYPTLQECKRAQTDDAIEPTTANPTVTEPSTGVNIPVVIGASVGAVFLVIILSLIIYVLCKPSRKKKERTPMTSGVSFAPHAHADLPHAGGTARRFAKKPEKEGATPNDININIISAPDMNKDRHSAMSAGSYQYINEKTNPDVNGNPKGRTNGHYMNDNEERPLPQAPKSMGYVNDGIAKETSPNSYSEV